MMKSSFGLCLGCVILLSACGPTGGGGGPGGPDGPPGSDCTEGSTQCSAGAFQTCSGGAWQTSEVCQQSCNPDLGCVTCTPNSNYSEGNDVHSCTSSGDDGGLVESCSGGLACSGGQCVDPCAEAAAAKSYLGCEYWATDLDN